MSQPTHNNTQQHTTTMAVSGVLKGYDQLLNVVLDDAVEYVRGERDVECSAAQ